MTTAIVTLRGWVRQDLRDTVQTYTFSNAEIDDLIGQGINQLGSFYPTEVIGSVTIIANTFTYALPAGISWPFRVTLYGADGTYQKVLEAAKDPSPNSGWDYFGGVLHIPPGFQWTAGYTLEIRGYGAWTYIDSNSSSSATTNLDETAIWAVREFCQSRAFERLAIDRGKFGEWQEKPGNTDVTALSLQSMASEHRRNWEAEKARLRTLVRRN
jgi:hypothetical protein